jgi:signal transduction histidine kinase
LRSFLDTILSSSDRASKVVQDMRNYIKDKRTDEKTNVKLRENIATVLNIFNFEISRKADIVFQVSDEYFIKGFDIHLFQLWANLIKNAAESFDSEHNGNYIKIEAEETKNEVIVHIENNGPMIPEEIQTKIFQKFYTTKSSKNGTGLGLSIVKKIVDEHNGKICLTSNENRTIFSISFPKN